MRIARAEPEKLPCLLTPPLLASEAAAKTATTYMFKHHLMLKLVIAQRTCSHSPAIITMIASQVSVAKAPQEVKSASHQILIAFAIAKLKIVHAPSQVLLVHADSVSVPQTPAQTTAHAISQASCSARTHPVHPTPTNAYSLANSEQTALASTTILQHPGRSEHWSFIEYSHYLPIVVKHLLLCYCFYSSHVDKSQGLSLSLQKQSN